jgi:DNA-binding NtrC family response regulator
MGEKDSQVPVRDIAPDVIVIHRSPETRTFLGQALFVAKMNATLVSSVDEARAVLLGREMPLAVVSVETPESLAAITMLRQEFRRTRVLAVSRVATPELVRDVLRAGASDFLFGQVNVQTLQGSLRALLRDEGGDEAPRPMASSADGKSPAVREESGDGLDASHSFFICHNEKMERVLDLAGRVATSDSTVLIQGESGTGKELLARWIHNHSPRATRSFVAVNCGALPENLLESQLFGHEKGSFTGAVQRQIGLFEVSDGGTIFLDEIGEMSLNMQVKLLRVLQSREFRRIGGSQVVRVNVRILAATNRDLKSHVENGAFRSDLFYRLNVICVEIPPLRERRAEIPHLVEDFCRRLAEERGLERKTFSSAAVEALQKFRWEGNVRELENSVERLVLLCRGPTVELSDVTEHLSEQQVDVALDSDFAAHLTLAEVKRLHIARVLGLNGGNKMKTARMLGINVKTLYNLIRSLKIPS